MTRCYSGLRFAEATPNLGKGRLDLCKGYGRNTASNRANITIDALSDGQRKGKNGGLLAICVCSIFARILRFWIHAGKSSIWAIHECLRA